MFAKPHFFHLLLPLFGLGLISAEDITMDEHNQSWRLASAWSDDLFPTADKDYFLADLSDNPSIMRSTRSGRDDGRSTDFPGRSLTIPAGTNFLVKQDLENTASLNDGAGNLILDGGAISFAPQSRVRDNNPRIRANDLHVTASTGSFITITGEVDRARFESTLTGSGDLRVTFREGTGPSTSGRSVIFSSVRNYTGKLTVEKGMLLDFNEDAFFPGGIEIADSAQLNVDQVLTFPTNSLVDSQNGIVPPGVYTGSSLNALGTSYRNNGGTLIISLTVTTEIDEDDGSVDPNLGTGTSLREAISQANPGDVILFDPSLDGMTIQLDANQGELLINKDLVIDTTPTLLSGITIDGGSNGDFIADENETRCLAISDGEAANLNTITLRGLTIQNGVSTAPGGNIRNRENLTLERCRIVGGRTIGENNTGGGISSDRGQLIITNSQITENQTEGRNSIGGGIANLRGTLTLDHCEISDNITTGFNAHGGGISNLEAEAFMKGCLILNNHSNAQGGGIFNTNNDVDRESFTMENCRIAGNQARSVGGGFRSSRAFVTMTNCEITNNRTTGFGSEGGGIVSFDEDLSVSFCTISGNRTEGIDAPGGGIFVRVVASRPGSIHFNHCTLSGNSTAQSEGGGYSQLFGESRWTHCTIVGNTAPIGQGGGIFLSGPVDVARLESCIVHDNSGGDVVADPTRNGFFTSVGDRNLVGTGNRIDNFSGNEVNTAPLHLAPLANYGGPTKTRPPLPGSPAVNAANGSGINRDQRGFGIVDIPDIGAAELQGDSINAEPILSFFFDSDQDGYSNGLEQAIGSNPLISDINHPNRFQIIGFQDREFLVQFGYVDSSIPLKLTRSTDLITFDEVIASSEVELEASTDVPQMIVHDPSPPPDRAFYRLEATLPE